jgi:hypothetical protein
MVTRNKMDSNYLSPGTNPQCTREQFSAILSPREYAHGFDKQFSTANLSPRETSHGLLTCLLDSNYDYIPSTPYKIICVDKVIIGFSIQFDPLFLTRP